VAATAPCGWRIVFDIRNGTNPGTSRFAKRAARNELERFTPFPVSPFCSVFREVTRGRCIDHGIVTLTGEAFSKLLDRKEGERQRQRNDRNRYMK